jgi:signal peptidase II
MWVALLMGAWVAGLDQLTKVWIRETVPLHGSIPVWAGCFDVTYVKNTGAAWGMFNEHNELLALLALVMLALLLGFRRRVLPRGRGGDVILGLLGGGIVGNLLDRLRLDFVTDYLDFYVGRWHWPAFNIADAAICAGVVFFVILSWRERQPAENESGEE